MHKIFFTILFSGLSVFSITAQDTRNEYSDTILLQQASSGINETPEYQDNSEEKDILSDTTLYISAIKISPDTIIGLKKDRRFAYIKNLDSLLKIKQAEDIAALRDMDKGQDSSLQRLLTSQFIQGFFWTIAIVFVIFILYRLFFSNAIFKRRSPAALVNVIPGATAVASVSDYDKLIHQSYKLGDYRLAARYLFLKTLMHLTEQEYLWQSADKTNYQYVQEITPDRKNEFASLVLTYEYIWYGNFPLDQETYTSVEKKFISFLNKI